MNNFDEILLKDLNTFVDDFLSVLDLEDKSEEEKQRIKLFTEDALSDRISLFILRNLKGEQLTKYEEMISKDDINPAKIHSFLGENIKDYKVRLEEDLKDFQEEIAERILNK